MMMSNKCVLSCVKKDLLSKALAMKTIAEIAIDKALFLSTKDYKSVDDALWGIIWILTYACHSVNKVSKYRAQNIANIVKKITKIHSNDVNVLDVIKIRACVLRCVKNKSLNKISEIVTELYLLIVNTIEEQYKQISHEEIEKTFEVLRKTVDILNKIYVVIQNEHAQKRPPGIIREVPVDQSFVLCKYKQ